MRLEPVEHGRNRSCALRAVRSRKSLPIRIQQHIVQPAGEIFRLQEIRERHFVARHLLGRPVGQPLHVSQIGHRHAPVEFVHPGRIDTRHLEPVAARTLLRLDEKHLDLIAGHKPHLPGNAPGDQNLLGANRIPDTGQLALEQMVPKKRPFVTAVHPLEHHAENRIGRLDHAPLHGIGSEPYDLACRADRSLELFAAQYRHRLDRPGASQIGDLDLGREAGDTIRDFPLETHDNGQSQNHHRHAQRHRDHGDTNHHTRTVAGSVMRDSARYEQFEIHPLPILHVFFMQSNINFSYFCSINRPL